jgi:hypothetical protein
MSQAVFSKIYIFWISIVPETNRMSWFSLPVIVGHLKLLGNWLFTSISIPRKKLKLPTVTTIDHVLVRCGITFYKETTLNFVKILQCSTVRDFRNSLESCDENFNFLRSIFPWRDKIFQDSFWITGTLQMEIYDLRFEVGKYSFLVLENRVEQKNNNCWSVLPVYYI